MILLTLKCKYPLIKCKHILYRKKEEVETDIKTIYIKAIQEQIFVDEKNAIIKLND